MLEFQVKSIIGQLVRTAFAIAMVFFFSYMAFAQQVVEVASSGMYADSLLGIPRRKMMVSESDPNRIWIFHAGTNPDAHYSNNGGLTWTGITFYNVGDHDSFDIDSSGNIHTGQRGSNGASSYKRISNPSTSSADYSSAYDRSFSHFSSSNTDVAVLAHGNNVWLFTREDNNSTIYYDLSTDGGVTWTSSGIVASGLDSTNRIGAIVIDNLPYAVIWNQSSPDELLFYYWNGSSFVQDFSLLLTLETTNVLTRVFSVTQTTDGRVHVAYWNNGAGNRIRHVYKRRADVSWSTPATVDNCNSDGLVCITSHGTDVYIAYLRPSIYNALTYRRFDGSTQTYDARVILDDSGDCRYPAFPKRVDPSSNYIPLAWTRGTRLFFHAIPASSLSISVTPDTWSMGEVAPGGVRSSAPAEAFTVSNDGTLTGTLSMQITNSGTGWTPGASQGVETYVLGGLFCGDADDPRAYFASDDVLSTTATLSTPSVFGNAALTEDGVSVPPGENVKLWFQFGAPTRTSRATPQNMGVTVAIQPD